MSGHHFQSCPSIQNQKNCVASLSSMRIVWSRQCFIFQRKKLNRQCKQTVPGLSFNTGISIIICCCFHCPISQSCGGIMVHYLLLISSCCRARQMCCADSEESYGFTLAASKKKKNRLVPQVLIKLISDNDKISMRTLILCIFKASVWAAQSWNKSHSLEVHSLAMQRLIRAVSYALVVPLGFMLKVWSITTEHLGLPNGEEKTIYNPLKIIIRQKQNYYVKKPKVFNINQVATTSAWGLGMAYVNHWEY